MPCNVKVMDATVFVATLFTLTDVPNILASVLDRVSTSNEVALEPRSTSLDESVEFAVMTTSKLIV